MIYLFCSVVFKRTSFFYFLNVCIHVCLIGVGAAAASTLGFILPAVVYLKSNEDLLLANYGALNRNPNSNTCFYLLQGFNLFKVNNLFYTNEHDYLSPIFLWVARPRMIKYVIFMILQSFLIPIFMILFGFLLLVLGVATVLLGGAST